ncbi:MAG: hypothetical protein LDL24_08730 [Treponema sp.]|nr:hypothetical protein [Treponema sp.]
MGRRHQQAFVFVFGLVLFLVSACSGAESADIRFIDQEGKPLVLETSQRGKSGLVRPGDSLLYKLKKSLNPGPNYVLALTYRVVLDSQKAAGGQTPAALFSLLKDPSKAEASQIRWQLPLSGVFLGGPGMAASLKVKYAIPMGSESFSAIRVDFKKALKNENPGVSIQLESMALEPLWFGFYFKDGIFSCSPFVSRTVGLVSIDVPDQFRGTGLWKLGLSAASLASPVSLRIGSAGAGGFSVQAKTVPSLMAGSLPEIPFPFVAAVQDRLAEGAAIVLSRFNLSPLPESPIPADPASILDYRQELWRHKDYEVFQWDRFPSILIFDTRSYEVQDRLFKRLAFYVEKAGFRGRLAQDGEIASLHGWNAHDYRSSDLADFFTTAEKTRFPLNREEQDLREILLAHGIIKAGSDGNLRVYTAGEGAIISISRESADYLRRLFMVHEAFHGLFFIDPDFQAFALERWTHLDPVAKKFLVAYFRNRGYDTADAYLMKNELMAYCLQQGVAGAAQYFGKTLPERLAEYPQYLQSMPEKDAASGTWPALAALFTAEAKAFSDYVSKRWGLEAGRVWSITKRSL